MSTENMNTPTEKQIQEVLAGTSTPEVARIVAAWFATDEGAAYLAKSMDRDAVQIKQGFEELYVNHEIPSEEMFARIRRNIRQKRIRRITFRVAAVLIPFVLLIGLFVQVNTRVICWVIPVTKKSMCPKVSACNDVSGWHTCLYKFRFTPEVSKEICAVQP